MSHKRETLGVLSAKTLKTSVSAAALAAGLTSAPLNSALAQSACDIMAPMTGDTVVCTFGTDPGTNDASPITTAIIAPGSENVDLTIVDPIARSGFDDIDATLTAPVPTVSLGGGSSILVRNATISSAALVGEGELALSDFGQVFKPPYDGFFNDYVAAFDDGATPTREDLQQIIDANGLNYTLADTDPVDDVLTAFAAAFNDAGIDASIGFDEDGDTFIQFSGPDGEAFDVFGLPASGEALEGLRDVLADAGGAVITLGAATDRSALTAVIERFATAPGSPAAVAAGQNVVRLGVFGSDDGNIFAIGSNGIDLAQGSVTTVALNDDGISVVGNDGAGIVLNAGGAETSAFELQIQPGADITVLGDNSAAIRVIGGNAVVGISTDLGTLSTLGNDSPLVSMTGGDSVLNLRLNELSTDSTVEYDFGGPYVTFGANSPLFEVKGDNTCVFLSSNQVGTRNPSDGFVSLGDGSTIFDWQLGDNAFVNADLLNARASTEGNGSSILHLTAGDTPDTDVLFAGNTFETTGADAAAFLIDATASAGSQDITLSANTITTQGIRAAGVDLTFGAVAGGTSIIALNSLSVMTSGDFADGIVTRSGVAGGDPSGSAMTGTVAATTVSTTGRFANALVVGENVTIYGPGIGAVPANGDAKFTVDTFEDFSATGLGARGIQNNGVIEVAGSGITYSAGKTGRIANAGTINGAGGVAVTFAGDTDDIFELQPTAITTGTVDGAGGTDTFILGGDGADTFDTDLLDTQYVNFEVFEKEDLSEWTITSDDTRAWTVNGGDLVVGTGTTIETGAASAFTISTGLTVQVVEGEEVITPVRGQLVIDSGAAVTSGIANVAAVSVVGVASVPDVDAPNGVRLINNLPDNFDELASEARNLAIQQGADVTVAGTLSTNIAGADGIVGTYGADLAPELSVYLTGDGLIQTSQADASAIRGGDDGAYDLTVIADGNSSIMTAGDRSGAILATGGSNIINVIAEDDFSIATQGADAHGVVALGGASSVTFFTAESTVSLETSGDGAFGVGSVGDMSIVSVTMDGNGRISTGGESAHAILLDGSGSVMNTTLTDNISIATTGDNAAAVFGPGSGSVLSLVAAGTTRLTTAGDSSAVIQVDDFDSSLTSIDIFADADRTQQAMLSEGNNADLVFVMSSAEGGSTFVFNAEAADSAYTGPDFETLGDGSALIDVNGGPNASLTVALTDIDAITRGASSNGYGLAVGDAGDLTVEMTGGSLATLGAGSNALDLSAGSAATLDLTLANTAITTVGADAVGIVIAGSLGGTNDVNIGGSVAATGARGHAVWLDRQAEDVELTGSLSTTGDGANGIGADGAVFGIVTTAASTITTTGTNSDAIWIGAEAQVPIDTATVTANGAILTEGDDASGIWVSTLAGDSFDDGIADTAEDRLPGVADVTLNGSINTQGESAYGIGAEGTGMTITVADGGSISTTGDDGDGIWLDYGDDGGLGGGFEDGTITMDGDILTTGDNAEGIWVDRSGLTTGGTTISVGGDIRTEGAESHGISVFYGAQAPMNAGNAGTITVSGDIDARGAGSDGIRVYLDDGASTDITIEAGGDVFAPNEGDRSIYLTSLAGASGTAAATITVDAASETASNGNVYSSTGLAIGEGNDSATPLVINTTLNIAGNVSAGGNDIVSIDLSTGDDVINVTEDGFIGGTVLLGEGDDVMTLAGTVRSLNGDAINTGTGDDTLVVLPTASILGGVDLAGGTDTLAFDGAAGTTGTVELLAMTVPFAVGVERTEKRGEGTWIIEGSDVPVGANLAPTFVLNGTVVIRSQILGTSTTNSAAGRITGSGGLGDLDNAGTFAPGEDGIGTFTIAGDLMLQPSSVLEIDIAGDGSADLIEVGDDAVLDGTLAVNGVTYPTGFPNQQDYVILTAAETVTGTFATVTDNLPDVDVTVAYSETDVTISYDKGQDESDKSIQANTVQSALVDGRLFAHTLRRRGVLMGAESGFASAGNPQLAQNGAPIGIDGEPRRYAVWGTLMGVTADVSSTPGQTGYSLGAGGLATGFDGFIPLNDAMVRLGVAVGYSSGDIDSDVSGADVDTWHIGAHAVYEKDKLGLSAAIAYGFQNYDIDRIIALTGAPSVTAEGEADGNVFSLSVGAKYTVYESDSFKVSPIAHIEHVSAKRGAYTESGTGILDLAVDAERFDRTFLGAGVRLEAENEGAGGIVYRPQLDLMYEHGFGDAAAVVTSQTANVQNIDFVTTGADQARNQLAVGAGVALDISQRVSAHIRYDGNYADGFTSHRGSVGVAVSF